MTILEISQLKMSKEFEYIFPKGKKIVTSLVIRGA